MIFYTVVICTAVKRVKKKKPEVKPDSGSSKHYGNQEEVE